MNFSKRLFIALMTLGLTSTAFAKITVYTNADAVQKTLSSTDFKELQALHGEVAGISVVAQKMMCVGCVSFKLKITLTSYDDILGARSCYLDASLISSVIKTKNGITVSQLSEPVLSSPACEK